MCHWIETENADDCAMTTSTTTVEPGCCSGLEGASEDCVSIETQNLCDRKIRCKWTVTDDASDCEVTTSTEVAGCCTGNDFEYVPINLTEHDVTYFEPYTIRDYVT